MTMITTLEGDLTETVDLNVLEFQGDMDNVSENSDGTYTGDFTPKHMLVIPSDSLNGSEAFWMDFDTSYFDSLNGWGALLKGMKFKMPAMKFKIPKIPKFKAPKIPKIKIKAPKIPRIKVPRIKIPRIKIPKIPRIKVPKINTSGIGKGISSIGKGIGDLAESLLSNPGQGQEESEEQEEETQEEEENQDYSQEEYLDEENQDYSQEEYSEEENQEEEPMEEIQDDYSEELNGNYSQKQKSKEVMIYNRVNELGGFLDILSSVGSAGKSGGAGGILSLATGALDMVAPGAGSLTSMGLNAAGAQRAKQKAKKAAKSKQISQLASQFFNKPQTRPVTIKRPVVQKKSVAVKRVSPVKLSSTPSGQLRLSASSPMARNQTDSNPRGEEPFYKTPIGMAAIGGGALAGMYLLLNKKKGKR
mgnify:CR=1 FL=1